MDNYPDRKRLTPAFSTMARSEAHQLRTEASGAAYRHLKDFTTRSRFNDSIDKFIAAQLQGIHSARSDAECESCLRNIQIERRYIREQDLALKLGKAKLYASAELTHTLDGWGYVINGVGLVLSGFQVVAGSTLIAASLSHGNIIGAAAGALIIAHGINEL